MGTAALAVVETITPQSLSLVPIDEMRSTLARVLEWAQDDINRIKDVDARIHALADYYRGVRDPERLSVAQEHFLTTRSRLSWLWEAQKRPQGLNSSSGNTVLPDADDLGINKGEMARLNLLALLLEEEVEAYIEQQKAEGKDMTIRDLLRMAAKKKSDLIRQANEPGIGVLYHGDAIDLLPELDPTFDCLMTDPPYSTEFADFGGFLDSWLDIAISKVRSSGSLFVWAGPYPDELTAYLQRLSHRHDFTLGNILVWHYTNTLGPKPTHTYKNAHQFCFYLYGPDAPPLRSPWLKDQTSVFTAGMPHRDLAGEGHPWEKPASVIETLLATATDMGQRVLDPFAGSGAIGVQATKLGRESLSIEVDAQYIAIAQGRGLHVVDINQ